MSGVRSRWLALVALGALLGASEARADRPLVDPTQLNVPWPKHSHYKQPWKAWLETLPAQAFLDGLGIYYNWNVDRASHDVQLRLLAAAGFSRIRVEVGWNNIDYDTLALKPAARAKLAAIAAAARAHGIRPLILLNAEHSWPAPAKALSRTLAAPAPAGARSLLLSDVSALLPHFTGLSFLAGGKMADILITAVDPTTRRVSLSKPLPLALPAGHALALHTLRYRPLAEPGSPDFEATVAGWLSYTRTVLTVLADAGLPAFDVEIWNELTFGSDFLRLNAYYTPPVVAERGYLQPGGRVWELGRRTVDMLRAEFPQAVPIWGLSNTSFFAVGVKDLPPRIRGQSYHPYFFVDYRSPADEQNGFARNLEGFAPTAPPYRVRMPEGAASFLKTESLARLLNPRARQSHPPGSQTFDHYMTEFGVNPEEEGVHDAGLADLLRAKTLLRGSLFWLNKGLKGIWFFQDLGSPDGKGYDLFPPEMARWTEHSREGTGLTLPLEALRNVTRLFRSGGRVSRPRALDLAVQALDGRGGGVVFAGSGRHPPLTHEDVFAALPFQLDDARFAIGVYVMSRNVLEPLSPVPFLLTVRNVDGRAATVRCLDPLRGVEIPVEVRQRTPSSIEVVVPAVDYPYLLDLREQKAQGRPVRLDDRRHDWS